MSNTTQTMFKTQNMEDLTDLFDSSLRLSAFRSAAKASKQASFRVSIGVNVEIDAEDNKENASSTSVEQNKTEKTKVRKEVVEEEQQPKPAAPVNIEAIKSISKKFSMKQAEKEIAERVKLELHERARKMMEEDRLREERFEEANRAAEETILKRMLENERALKTALDAHDKACQEFDEHLKVKSEESKRRGMEMKQRSQILEKFRALHELFKRSIERFMKAYTGMDKDLQTAFGKYKSMVFQTTKMFEENFGAVDKSTLTFDELGLAQKLYQEVDALTADMTGKLDEIKARQQKDEEERRAAEEAQRAAAAEQERQVAEQKAKEPATPPANVMDQFVPPDALKRYERIMTIYKLHADAVKKLSEDETMKKYRMLCQFAINIPINAISAISSQHLSDKFDKLATLLSGQVVKTTSGDVSVNLHPLGKTYSTLLLAKKFVNQSDTIVSNNSAEFPVAATLVALWKIYPDVGQFFLSYLYRDCPYFVPYFIPQVAGQSDEEYMKSLGYRFSNGVCETHELYLKRMVGIARLYAAVWITSPRRGDTTPHPHGIENGWRWLVNIINLDPLPDICATLIHETLSVAGHALMQTYGKQFFKLLLTIQRQYMPKLSAVDHGGPKSRLEEFINRAVQEGKINPPEKVLPPGFW